MGKRSGTFMLMLASLLGCAALLSCARSAAPVDGATIATANPVVTEGHARFMVLSPTLIRLEYADDDHFEDGPTQTVESRAFGPVPYSSSVENGERVIRTSALTLRYRQNTGAFTAQNLSVDLHAGARAVHAQPDWAAQSNPANLGGWRRGLDNEQDPQPLHQGLLSRDGWYLLDDSATVLLTNNAPGFALRPARSGSYQDGYFFGYGHDYTQGLADLRQLTGAAPLLPRKALGVWFSRYWAYSDAELRDLVAQFRAHQVPLDTLSIDTDWKLVHSAAGCVPFAVVAGARVGDPCSWNGWGWNTTAFPDPADFLSWAHDQGIEIGLNIHPSIASDDPQFAQVQAASGGLPMDSAVPPCTLLQADPLAQCHVFDWTNPAHLAVYFALHEPIASGVDFWWLDWCCDGSSAIAPGLTADTWINAHYQQDTQARGSRWPAFSRIGASFQEGKAGIANNGAGAFAEHRHTLHFTGDTCGTWQILAYEAEFTAAEGNIGMPYVTHDIGSFLGPPKTGTGCNGTLGHTSHLPDDMYVRWVQFGAFQPIERLHSHHGDRLPWDYPGVAETAATAVLRLRERMVPYLYTLSRQAHDRGLPMVRSLYLQWPELDEAYNHHTEYTLGDSVLIAPVTSAGDPASVSVWLPPGIWNDFYTGEQVTGPVLLTRSVPLAQYPVFMRAGAIVPLQPELPTTSALPRDALTLMVWPGAEGHFDLYDDEGRGFGYLAGTYSMTPVSTATSASGCVSVRIGAASGNFPGALAQRDWDVQLFGVSAPGAVRVNGQALAGSSGRPGWSYDNAARVLTVRAERASTDRAIEIIAGGSCAG